MKNKWIYLINEEWFESGTLTQNPISLPDHKMQEIYPDWYQMRYDLRLSVVKPASRHKKEAPFYNDYRERFGTSDMEALKSVVEDSLPKNIFLSGFHQAHFEYLAPFLKESAKVVYLFKCPKIHDLSLLSEFKNLKCVCVYWNQSLESLWDMRKNQNLTAISFHMVNKLRNIEPLKDSAVRYITFDSTDNSGNTKEMLFDESVFAEMPNLKYLTLVYK